MVPLKTGEWPGGIMPKKLVAVAVRQPVLQDYEDEPIPEGHVRVKSDFGSPKRGTELHLYHDENRRFPLALGNMCVGKVIEVGAGVDNLSTGDRVASHGSLQETHVWRASESLDPAWPDKVWPMHDNMTWQEAVCFDPAHFALCAVRDGQVRLGDRVAVFGLGAIGQMTAQMARLSGAAFVAVVDPIKVRREAAVAAGADAAFDPTSDDVVVELRKLSNGKGLDVTIETSGVYQALDGAIRSTAKLGNTTVLGLMEVFKGGFDPLQHAHNGVPNLVFSHAEQPNRDYPNWDFNRVRQTCWDLLAAGRFQCEGIVSPIVPFEKSAEAFEEMDLHPEKSIKLGIEFG